MHRVELSNQRQRIDQIDRQIIDLLQQRVDVVTEIGRVKQRKGLPVYDPKREQEKIEALASLCEGEKQEYIAQILARIMEVSRHYQEDHPQRYGLLGQTLGHSHSPRIQRMLADYEYGLFEREPDQVADFLAESSWRGLNVTIPYKRAVMPYCDVLSDTSVRCNSVNTIVRQPDGSIYGTNTDYDGFRYVVERSGIDIAECKCLVLGSGGVSGTVCCVLEDLGADPVIIISRSGEDNYENLDRHRDAQIIVNTTPVGMFPKAGLAALDVRQFTHLRAVYDLIYNPLRTRLMLDAEEMGVPAFGGLPMLVAQAAKAAQLFAQAAGEDGPQIPTDVSEEVWIDSACRALQRDLEHIVFIGMPGVGKTSVGSRLAQLTGRTFVDLDEAIANWEGRSPEEIIRADGVDRFRQIETQALIRILREGALPQRAQAAHSAASTSLVLATGGGIVEREENRQLLRENGQVIWLQRPLEDLPTDGRPVSQADGLAAILARRQPRYEAWSDLQVQGIGVQETAEKIASLLD